MSFLSMLEAGLDTSFPSMIMGPTSDVIHHLKDQVADGNTFDGGMTQQPSVLLAVGSMPGFPSIPEDAKRILGQAAKGATEAAEKEGVLTKSDFDKTTNKLIAGIAAGLCLTGFTWFDLTQRLDDLTQRLTPLVDDLQERALSSDSTKLKLVVNPNNIAVIELSVPKRLRGFEEKSFTLKSLNGGKTLSLVFSYDGVVQTWQEHVPITMILDPEDDKKGVSYKFVEEETADRSQDAKCRIKLLRPLVSR